MAKFIFVILRMELITLKKSNIRKHLKYIFKNFLYDAFPEFELFEDDGSELFHDASCYASGQFSY